MLNKLTLYQYKLFFLVCFTLPMFTRLNNVILGFFILFSGIIVFKEKKHLQKSLLIQFFPVFIFFLLALVAALYGFKFTFFKYIERYISLLFIPIVFWMSKDRIQEFKKNAFYGLLLGCITTLLICYINVFYEIVSFQEPISYFLRWRHLSHRFTEIADTHPAYLGLFICTSTFFLLFHANSIAKWLKVVLLIFFFFGMLQLTSRVALFMFLCTILIYIFSLFKINFKYGLAILIFISLTSLFFLSKGSSYYKERVFSSKSITMDSRFDRLKISIDVFLENPILGVGFHSVDELRVNKYKQHKDYLAAKKKYNAHNQFIDYLAINGIFGGLIYIGVFAYLIVVSIKSKDYTFIFIIVSFFIANQTESMLLRIKGIEYFSIFTSLFLINQKKEHTES